ncbi:MAG: hypothetical protein VW258_11470 [Thalassolituus sp.]
MHPISTPLTSSIRDIGRVPVDNQQTSFEANEQFRFCDEWDDVAAADQIVYYVEITNPIILQSRKLMVFTGGRKYRAFAENPAAPIHTFTGALASSGVTSLVNTIPREGVPYPVTGVTIRRADGAGIFTPAAGVNPSTIDFIVSDGNVNQATSNYSPDGTRVGVRGGAAFYLVLDHRGANVVTEGGIQLDWEERYS